MNEDLKKHLIDLLKGAAGAMITASLLALVNYLGAHVPNLLGATAMLTGAYAGVRSNLS